MHSGSGNESMPVNTEHAGSKGVEGPSLLLDLHMAAVASKGKSEGKGWVTPHQRHRLWCVQGSTGLPNTVGDL